MILVDKCLFINRAPFKDNLEISFKEGVNVLCGINGRGKTTILSYIVDAFYEMAKPNYRGSFEGKEYKYYRLSSSFHTIDPGKPSIVYIRFKVEERTIDYIDVRGILSEAEYNDLVKYETKIEYGKIKNGLQASDTVKLFSCDDTDKAIKDAFAKNVLTYFPSYRYELPGYLNTPYKENVEISDSIRFSGELPNPIEVCTGLAEFSSWILDVVLDWEVNKSVQKVQAQDRIVEIDLTPERTVWNNLSEMMKKILISKECPGIIRFGIGKRNTSGNRVSVIHVTPFNEKEQLCPNLSLLSSGETALMCLFGEIIRQADTLRNNIPLNQIQGIVLIDEIEKHLHIRLQKEILPGLLKLFPGIQFIVSSHSPFLNMGLASEKGIKSQIFDLDNGALQCEPTTNEVYQNTYELFLGERNTYAEALSSIQPKIDALTKPLVITEGKTDWKHLKKALEFYKANGEYTDLDFELLEYDRDFGDSKLDGALKHYSQFPNRFKIVGIFDCDEANGKRIHFSGGVQEYGNDVYGMSIPIPDFRSYNTSGISIEFLYKDTDLKKLDSNGRRLFVSSEFNANGRLSADLSIGVKNEKEIKEYLDPSKEKIHDHHVIDIHGKSLALSKEDFAVNILDSTPPFDSMDFSGYKAVFDRLNGIINPAGD
ncbi:MAG: ATP-binding protein [Bacteroidales bacterium]|nr:ATP-binding protein [Bacteroidales bacterium]